MKKIKHFKYSILLGEASTLLNVSHFANVKHFLLGKASTLRLIYPLPITNLYPLLFFVIIFFIVCFGSCKKNDDKTIIISGKIYDPNFKSYVPAVKVRIASSKISSGIYSSAFSDIATVYSDNNGSYSFSFKKETVSSYKIYISKSKYFDYEQEIFPDNLSTDNDNSINLNIFPVAFIKYRLKNTSPFSPEDMVVFQVAKDNNCSYCCPLSSIAGYGMNYDTTFSCKSRGQQNLSFSWHYLKNKIDINKDSSIFCKAFDTTYCFIRY